MRTPRNKACATAAMKQEALDAFRGFLHERSLRSTEVREAIVRAALDHGGHFRVDDLVDRARRTGMRISAATVYRALPLLVEAKIIEPTEVSGEQRSYEAIYGRKHHDHLICRSCKRVVEFELAAFAVLEQEIAARHGFILVDHFHELIGICGNCRAPDNAMRA
jgi:Fur family ferric uptake transcriptional regulator